MMFQYFNWNLTHTMRAHALNLREQPWRYTYPGAEPEFVAGLFLLKCP